MVKAFFDFSNWEFTCMLQVTPDSGEGEQRDCDFAAYILYFTKTGIM